MTPALHPNATPSNVVRAALAAHVAGDWPTVVALADADSIAEWSTHFINANTHIPTFEEMRDELPGASTEHLQSLVDGLGQAARRFIAALPDHLAGVRTLGELHRLSPREVLLRFFQGSDKTAKIARAIEAAYEEAGLPLPDRKIYGRLPLRFEVRSEKRVDDETTRVTFAEEGHDGPDGEWLLRRQSDGGWRILVRPDFLLLPGARAHLVDDPVLLAYLERRRHG